MNRRTFIISAGAVASLPLVTLTTIGCGSTSKATIVGLAQILGNAVANLATILGNTAIATQITQYTTQLVNDINAWTPGGTTQDIILVITDLENAISLIPVTPEIQGLIELALGTIQGILAFFPSAAAMATEIAAKTKAKQVHLAKFPKDAPTFKIAWNSLVPASASGALIP
jgi:hypothetical protein